MRKFLLLFLLSSPAFADIDCGSTNPASPCTGQSHTQDVDGYTYTFNYTCSGGDCQHGRFWDGTGWVRHSSGGNVVISSVTPDKSFDGLQKNPGITAGLSTAASPAQGLYTGNTQAMTFAVYNSALDLTAGQLPYSAPPDNGVYVKAIGNDPSIDPGEQCHEDNSHRPNCVDSYAAMVVVADVPDDSANGGNTFRPWMSGSTKLFITLSDLDLTLWPRFSSITAGTSAQYNAMPAKWASVFPEMFSGLNGDNTQRLTPGERNISSYPAQQFNDYMNDIWRTMSTDTSAAKTTAIYSLIQRGIDIYGAYIAGSEWNGGAGYMQGHWIPMLLFGAVYNGASKTTVQNNIRAASANSTWDSDGEGSTVQFVELFQVRPNINGLPVWGSYDAQDGCTAGANYGRYWIAFFNVTFLGQSTSAGDNKGTCGDPYRYIDGPAGQPLTRYFAQSGGLQIQMGLLLKIWPELAYVANYPTMQNFAERLMNGAGRWTTPDICNKVDSRESTSCNPYNGVAQCNYYGNTWGADLVNNDGTCVTTTEAQARGNPVVADRYSSQHLTGRTSFSVFYSTPGYNYWDTLVPRSGNQISATGTITDDDP